MQKNYLDDFGPDNWPTLAQCIIRVDHHIRFTPIGLKRYRERFGRAGIDIRKVTTLDALHDALVRSFPFEEEAFEEDIRREHKPGLLRDLILAAVRGDHEESARLRARLERRQKGKLRLVGSD